MKNGPVWVVFLTDEPTARNSTMPVRFFRSETTPVMPLALVRVASSSMRLRAAWRPSEMRCVMESSSPPVMV